MDDTVDQLNARVAELERENAALLLQAQCWAAEARAQQATVYEAYQAVTGATGEPGDWNGAEPVRDKINVLQARIATLEALVRDYREACRGQHMANEWSWEPLHDRATAALGDNDGR